ncbi:hypothetical protein BJP25_08025 [Actinokineospora bangkokensis]|uniref:Uncharacterized protein n=1 Tax=Actinokineospora bangkokensis TaxID=1193682 RepID=A0A1Q9LSA4_9PSEU|nr:hypothetical protein BJP25_08025 [Actinokineospora bangkokensis]
MAAAALLVGGCGAREQIGVGTPGPASSAAVEPGTPEPAPAEPGSSATKLPAPVDPAPVDPVPGPTPDPGYAELPADRVRVGGQPGEYQEPRAWVSPDGLSLQVVGVARDGCAGVEAGVVESTGTTVRVRVEQMTAPQGDDPDSPRVCTQVLTAKLLTVPLAEPLGTRGVVLEAAG